jgi:hypothetical protein
MAAGMMRWQAPPEKKRWAGTARSRCFKTFGVAPDLLAIADEVIE